MNMFFDTDHSRKGIIANTQRSNQRRAQGEGAPTAGLNDICLAHQGRRMRRGEAHSHVTVESAPEVLRKAMRGGIKIAKLNAQYNIHDS